jgi:UPF0755 protein
MNPWLRRLITVLAVLGLCYALFWYTGHLLDPVDPHGKTVSVSIPMGANVGTISKRLKDAGLIHSPLAFTLMARVLGESKNMKAGEYQISPSLGVLQIIDKLVAGDAEAQWVVIPEGKTLAQVASLLAARRLADADDFIRAAHHMPKKYGLAIPVSQRSVEGYLMPDTYNFPKRTNERQVIRQMLKNWNAKVLRPNKALFKKSDLPLDKIVILASLIEREARVPEDRGLISCVIRNRLKKKMRLQVDATVIYALPRHKEVLSFADLKIDSPYNTYKNAGLPPGPICNPGLKSVLAALQPARKDYLFYVAQPDGRHIFSTTWEQHKAAIARVRQMRRVSSAK